MYLIADSDSRAPGGAHPTGHLWDNGASAVAELKRMMQVRAKAMEKFGEQVIPFDTPMSELEARLVPIYLSHRYQVEAASKVLGGVDYRYALRGDGQKVAPIVSPAEQREALNAILATLDLKELILPERLLALMPPPALGFARSRENFRGRTGLTFDALAPVESAANIVFALLLHPERASRLEQNYARNTQNPAIREVLMAVERQLYPAVLPSGMNLQGLYALRSSYLYHLMALANDARSAPSARSEAYSHLRALDKASTVFEAELIKKFFEDPKQLPLPRPAEPPPGMPIGDEESPLW
jgi:hypothetical protein